MAEGRLRAVDWAALIEEWTKSGFSRATMQDWVHGPKPTVRCPNHRGRTGVGSFGKTGR